MIIEQRQKIIEILAYRYAEICKANGVHHDNDYNWKRAEQIFDVEIKINGKEWLLSLLKENKDEDNTSI
jgi:hypothetical protein